MKCIKPAILLALMVPGLARAGDFSGPYLGGDVGVNRSSTTGALTTSTSSSASYGLQGGYGWNLGGTFLGVEGFVNNAKQANHNPNTQYGSNAFGLGLKIGVPIDNLMPYARLGYDRTSGSGALSGFSAGAANSGLGLMYKVAPNWSLEGEWANTSSSATGIKLKANNFSFGLNYHFDTSPSGASTSQSK